MPRDRSLPRTNAIFLILLLAGGLTPGACGDDSGEEADAAVPTDAYPFLDPEIERRVDELLAQMTLEEKVEQMHGKEIFPENDLYLTPANERLGIPGFKMVDGPRGVRAGRATTFPVGMARGATWDVDLEERVGEAMGLETAAKGGNVLLAPTINLLRHPRWGRAQETYGEDSHLLGRMGVAFIRGVQRHVLASAKHYALNSIEDTRYDVDVLVDERTLRELYLPHFRAAVQEARVGTVMSAYNRVNGHYCAENEVLLREILKGEWRFDGLVESDWFLGVYSTVESANAGLDIEMPAPAYFGEPLIQAVEQGDVDEATIDEAVRRILRQQLRFRLDDPPFVDPAVVESAAHLALAREVAEKSIVLLKNAAGALPLDLSALGSLAVVGSLADATNLGDRGSSNCVPSRVVTPLAGIRALAGSQVTLWHVAADTLSGEDSSRVAEADAAIVVVGLTADDEGENMPGSPGDRAHLGLSDEHQALISQVAALSGRTVVVLEGGSALTMPWIDQVEAVLMAWYPGMEGGAALAGILFGEVCPSGRLPLTFPADATQLPEFSNDEESVTYDYFHGYLHLDHEGLEPLFPFGFGLSYTAFAYDNLALSADQLPADPAAALFVEVDVTNTGDRAGAAVVQVYVGFPGSAVARAERLLKGFARVSLDPGETETVSIRIWLRDLAYFDVQARAWEIEPITYDVQVGPSSRDLPLQASFSVQ